MRNKILLIVFILMMFTTICFAGRSTPYSAGLVLDDSLTVIGVNIAGPSFIAGIRPGDTIISVNNNGYTLLADAARESIYSDDNNTITVVYRRSGEELKTNIIKRKILDAPSKSTFYILGNAQDNYDRLLKTLTFHPKVSALFPIQSTDPNLKIIRTYSNVARKTIKDIPDYVVSPGGNGFGLTALETIGNFAITDTKEGQSILKVNLGFRAEWSHLFGQTWGNFDSSGVLEKKVIECMFDKNSL